MQDRDIARQREVAVKDWTPRLLFRQVDDRILLDPGFPAHKRSVASAKDILKTNEVALVPRVVENHHFG